MWRCSCLLIAGLAAILQPITQQLLRSAGISQGMRVLVTSD